MVCPLSRGVTDWYAVCYCSISWSYMYSLAFYSPVNVGEKLKPILNFVLVSTINMHVFKEQLFVILNESN